MLKVNGKVKVADRQRINHKITPEYNVFYIIIHLLIHLLINEVG